MPNNGSWVVNLGKDPEELELGGRTCWKLRCAEKAANKRAITRWFTAIVGGPDCDTASNLESGDTLLIAGEMALTEYKKKGAKKGEPKVREDEMPFAKIVRVIKSDKFFASLEKSDEDSGDDAPGEASDGVTEETPPDLAGLD